MTSDILVVKFGHTRFKILPLAFCLTPAC